jgi:hypothetical protein
MSYSHSSDIDEAGSSTAYEVAYTGTDRLNRVLLTRSDTSELRRIKLQLDERMASMKATLVQLLVERDALHMKHDSLLVDVDDLIGRRCCRGSKQWEEELGRLESAKRLTAADSSNQIGSDH